MSGLKGCESLSRVVDHVGAELSVLEEPMRCDAARQITVSPGESQRRCIAPYVAQVVDHGRDPRLGQLAHKRRHHCTRAVRVRDSATSAGRASIKQW